MRVFFESASSESVPLGAIIYEQGIKQNVVRDKKIVTYRFLEKEIAIIYEQGIKRNVVVDEEIITYLGNFL